jgi:hypothetical protein
MDHIGINRSWNQFASGYEMFRRAWRGPGGGKAMDKDEKGRLEGEIGPNSIEGDSRRHNPPGSKSEAGDERAGAWSRQKRLRPWREVKRTKLLDVHSLQQ